MSFWMVSYDCIICNLQVPKMVQYYSSLRLTDRWRAIAFTLSQDQDLVIHDAATALQLLLHFKW